MFPTNQTTENIIDVFSVSQPNSFKSMIFPENIFDCQKSFYAKTNTT